MSRALSDAPAWSAAKATLIGPSSLTAGVANARSAVPRVRARRASDTSIASAIRAAMLLHAVADGWTPVRSDGRKMAALQGRDSAVDTVMDHASSHLGHALQGEPEMLEDGRARCRRPVVIQPDDGPCRTDPALPAQRGARLHGDPPRRR